MESRSRVKRCFSVAPAGQEIGAVRESKRALLVLFCGWLMTKHSAQPAGMGRGHCNKAEGLRGEGNFETRAGPLRIATRLPWRWAAQ